MNSYMAHLLVYILPILIGQWLIAHKIFRRNLRAILGPTLIAGVYLSACDALAIKSGIWFFGESQLAGLFIGPLPIEEILFFFLTALLVSQSVVMLLPQRFRK